MRIYLIFIGLIVISGFNIAAKVKLPAIFENEMVLQRETSAPIWGWADVGEKVTVTGSWGATAETTADKAGKWQVALTTPKAGGPFTLTVQGSNKIVIKDVLSGEVWLCSGQSNMGMAVIGANNHRVELKAAQYPRIRLFKIRPKASKELLNECQGNWQPCNPQTVRYFSATGYFFGRDLYKHLKDVPIGLIQAAWGGTCIEAWTPWNAQKSDKFALKRKASFDKRIASFNEAAELKKYKAAMEKWNKKNAVWKRLRRQGRAPRRPRKKVHPLKNQNYPSNLYRGMINPVKGYAIRGAIWYQGEANAHRESDAKHYREQLNTLVSSWREAWGQGDFPFYYVQLPNFRKPWTSPAEIKAGWPVIRESFLHAAKNIPNSDMAITIDVGDAQNIHPKNKQAVGNRLARLALNDIYGIKDVVRSGPVFVSAEKSGHKVVVTFNNGGSPLFFKGKELKGFAVADKDGKVTSAFAKIIAPNKVELSSAKLPDPEMVYYAWGNNPVGANLANKAGLPASPFRAEPVDESGFLNLWGLF